MPDGRCQNHVEIDVRVLEAIGGRLLGSVAIKFLPEFPGKLAKIPKTFPTP